MGAFPLNNLRRSLTAPLKAPTASKGLSLDQLNRPIDPDKACGPLKGPAKDGMRLKSGSGTSRLSLPGANAPRPTAAPRRRHYTRQHGARFAPQPGRRNSPTMGLARRAATPAARPQHKATAWLQNRQPVRQPRNSAPLPRQAGTRPAAAATATPAAAGPVDASGVNGVGRNILQRLSQQGVSRQQVEQIARQNGVPLNLMLAVINKESGGRNGLVSRAGARGLMQLMPATARAMGVRNANDPIQNLQGGARYLGQMLRQHGGNVQLALAAYNAGPGNVRKYGGIPPFRETRTYVQRIMEWFRS